MWENWMAGLLMLRRRSQQFERRKKKNLFHFFSFPATALKNRIVDRWDGGWWSWTGGNGTRSNCILKKRVKINKVLSVSFILMFLGLCSGQETTVSLSFCMHVAFSWSAKRTCWCKLVHVKVTKTRPNSAAAAIEIHCVSILRVTQA